MKAGSDNPVLSAELARLSKADAEHVAAGRTPHLTARTDLSVGSFPSVAKIRYYEITWFRVRPGHEQEFEQLAKAFQAAYRKAAPQTSYRFYQVVAGVPGPTYMVFSSVQTPSGTRRRPLIPQSWRGSAPTIYGRYRSSAPKAW